MGKTPNMNELKRQALFIPCGTKEHLHRWIKIYLGLDMPNTIVCDEEVRHPPSDSCPMDLIWEIYSKAMDGTDPKFTQILGFAARESAKTLSAAILEVLCLVHLKRNVAHLAALEVQAKNCQNYVEKFLKRPFFKDFLASKNKREIVFTRYEDDDGNIISPVEFEALDVFERNRYIEVSNWIKIVICTVDAANGLHAPFAVMDELDLADPSAVEEAKMIPTPTEDGKLPITFFTSTRKYSFGLVQKEIDRVHETDLQVRHWNLIDVTQACPPSRHLPDESKIPIYYSINSLRAIPKEEWDLLSEKEKEQYDVKEGYSGCLKNCKMFAACQGRLVNKQTSKSPLLKPVDHTQATIRKVSVEHAKAQYLCFSSGTQIMMWDGTCKNIENIKVGDLVLTHKGNIKKVIEKIERKHNGEILKLKNYSWTNEGTFVTPEHPFFSNGVEFKSVSKFNFSRIDKWNKNTKTGDYFSLPYFYNENKQENIKYTDFVKEDIIIDNNLVCLKTKTSSSRPIPLFFNLNYDFGWIVGFYLAEGNISGRVYSKNGLYKLTNITFSVHSQEFDFHNKIRDFAKSIKLTTSENLVKGTNYGMQIDIYNSTLSSLFYQLFNTGADKKKIHPFLINCNREFLSGILDGFWDGDGTEYKTPNSRKEITTISYELASQLFLIASRLGLAPRFKVVNTFTKKQPYRIYFNDIEYKFKQKRTKYKFNCEYNLYRADTPEKIDFDGNVYNLEVEDDNSYIANGLAVHNCYKPSSEGLVYPNFFRESHMLSPAQMAQRMTGEEYPKEFNKSQLIDLIKSLGGVFVAGMDHGFTHHFSVVTGGLVGHVLYIFDVISEGGLELPEKIELCKEKILHLQPKIYPDNAYPADNKTFRRHGFKMINFKKDVLGGIEAVRSRIMPGTGSTPNMYFLKDDPGCELLASRILRYHWKLDQQGNLTDEPDSQDDDELDALRYLCQNVPVEKSKVIANFDIIEKNSIYGQNNPNKNWLKQKINELSGDSDDKVDIKGKPGGFMFSI